MSILLIIWQYRQKLSSIWWFLYKNFALMSKKVHKITPKIMRLFAEYLLNICGIFVEYLLNFKSNCWHFADSNFFYNSKIFANSLMISWQPYCFIIFLTTNSQKNEHFVIFICISKLEKFLYGMPWWPWYKYFGSNLNHLTEI